MSNFSEEAIFQQLFSTISSPLLSQGVIKYASRKLVTSTSVPTEQLPALFQTQRNIKWNTVKGTPGIVSAEAVITVYANSSANPVFDANNMQNPSSQLDPLYTAIKGTLAIPSYTDTQTLGGYVSHAWISSVRFFEALIDKTNILEIVVSLEWNESGTASIFDRGSLYIGGMKVGSLQKVGLTVETKFERDKTGYGAPIKFFGGDQTIKGTADFAEFDNTFISNMIFQSATITSGSVFANEELVSIPSGLNYTAALPVNQDLGVYLVNATQNMVNVSGTPLEGQYSISGSTYTFNSSDVNANIRLDYLTTSISGTTWNLSNTVKGNIPSFQVVLYGTNDSRNSVVQLNYCSASKLNITFDSERWSSNSFNFEASSAGQGTNVNIGLISSN